MRNRSMGRTLLLGAVMLVSAACGGKDEQVAVGHFQTGAFSDQATSVAFGAVGDRVSFGSIAIQNDGAAPIVLDHVAVDLRDGNARFLGATLMGTPRSYGTTGAIPGFPPSGAVLEGRAADQELVGSIVPVTALGEMQPYILFVGIELMGPGPAYVDRVRLEGHSGGRRVVGLYEMNFAICLRADGESFGTPVPFTADDQERCPFT